jgi:hypothetical protein
VRLAAFLASFGTALLMAGLCVAAMVMAVRNPDSEGAAAIIYCGPLLTLPFAGWALAEWQAFVMGRPRAERQAALCSAVFGGLLLFVGSAGLSQGLPEAAGPWAETVLGVVAAVGALLLGTGVLRLSAANSSVAEASDDEEAGEEDDVEREAESPAE